MSQFPDDTGADVFVQQYPALLAPADRRALASKPPLLILRVPGEGAAYPRQVTEALEEAMGSNGKLVPQAVLAGDEHPDLLTLAAGDKLGCRLPRHMTPDRFPRFWLIRTVVQLLEVSRDAEGGASLCARALRDHAYQRRAEEAGGLPSVLWKFGKGDAAALGGVPGFLLGVLWHPLTIWLPRRLWTLRKTRELLRPMLLAPIRRRKPLGEELQAGRSRDDVFQVLAEWAASQAHRLRLEEGCPTRAEALEKLDRWLMTALLQDIRIPPVGRLLPRRQRRTARPVLLVALPEGDGPEEDGPEGDGPEVRSVERFLCTFHRARAAMDGPGPLVIAVGRPSERLLARLGNPRESGLSRAARVLSRPDDEQDDVLLVPLAEEPFRRPGLAIRQAEPRLYRLGWRGKTSLVTSLSVLAVAGLAWALGGWLPEARDGCAGGNVPLVGEGGAERPEIRPGTWYDGALDAIHKENERAEKLASEQKRAVRTVVHFTSSKPTDETSTLFDGAIPELRGIAMWQDKRNSEAVSDDNLVPLRVRVIPTGKAFRNAEDAAKRLVEEVDSGKRRKDYEKVVGVLGFAQSRNETAAALRVLDRNGIPAVGTTATADEMVSGKAAPLRTYWPSTPLNTTEARIAARFVSEKDIVPRRGSPDECRPAERAIVVTSESDLYSKSLATKFEEQFKGPTERYNFAQGDGPSGTGSLPITSARVLADAVCESLREQPASVVYWTARAREFTAFVNALNNQGACAPHNMAVLGGNELTNVALTGAFDDRRWLHLYYAAHRLPAGDGRLTERGKTEQFIRAYDRFVPGKATSDPWRQDGHAAVSYDAIHTLAQAVDAARTQGLDHDVVLQALTDGISFDGATGHVSYEQGLNQPPRDKTLVLLRQSSRGPVVVAACGAYEKGESYQAQDSPCAPR